MIELMRHSLRSALDASRSPHAGLMLNRGLKQYISGSDGAGIKAELIQNICKQKPSTLYQRAIDRWKTITCSQNFSSWHGQLDGRLLIGLATGGALETGVITSHSYGMPLIPGSSVKGMARAYAQQLKVPETYMAVLFGEDEESAKSGGRLAGAGSLVWHDAWWSPSGNPFVEEVVTVHHQEYYAGTGAATDFDSPVPNAQIGVQGTFYFVIEGEPAWTTMAISLLQQALSHSGIGAKRAAGYGFIQGDKKANDAAQAQLVEHRNAEMLANTPLVQRRILQLQSYLEKVHKKIEVNDQLNFSKLWAELASSIELVSNQGSAEEKAELLAVIKAGEKLKFNISKNKEKEYKAMLAPLRT